MSAARKAPVPMPEQVRLINECRRSGLSDAEWCREHGIAPSTFYNWVARCRKANASQVPSPGYGHRDVPGTRQDVVAVGIVPDRPPEQRMAPDALPADTDIDNSHTIEIRTRSLSIRICNGVDPELLARTLRLLKESTC
jgi:transposase-like protein